MTNIQLLFFGILCGLILFAGCIGSNQYDSETQKKLSECDKNDPFWKDTCYSFVAQEKNDLSICDKIATHPTRPLCYVSIAINLKDPTICKKLQNQVEKDFCFHDFAVKLNKPEICNDIINQNTADSCQDLISK